MRNNEAQSRYKPGVFAFYKEAKSSLPQCSLSNISDNQTEPIECIQQ